MCDKLHYRVETKHCSHQDHEEWVQKIGYHHVVGVSIDRNDCAILIFKEIWANDTSTQQAAANSHS